MFDFKEFTDLTDGEIKLVVKSYPSDMGILHILVMPKHMMKRVLIRAHF